jgi:hypothetical protein
MQQPATAPSASSSTFAGLLASFAAPAAADRTNAWNNDDLADDVATLSYERALRAHSRYRSPEPSELAFAQPLHADVLRICEALPDEVYAAELAMTRQPANPLKAEAEPEFTPGVLTASDRNLKCASITIRVSKEECAQLRRRAFEAKLTVSAYLRSCTFETESLRALVKDTLAKLRTEPSPAGVPAPSPVKRGWAQWLARFWPHARGAQRVAQV